MTNPTSQSLEDEISKLLRDYHRYVRAYEIAADNKESHTTVSTAIDDANKTHEAVVARLLALIASQVAETTEKAVRTAYRERAQLISVLSRLFPSHLCADDNEPDWAVVCIHVPNPNHYVSIGGMGNMRVPGYQQAGWHISARDRDLFKHLKVKPNH